MHFNHTHGFRRHLLSAAAVASLLKDSLSANNDDISKRVTQCDAPPSSKPGPKILFLGSGSSTGCPKPICSLLFPPLQTLNNDEISKAKLLEAQQQMLHKCKVSKIATTGNPINNKNYRNNPSILISHANDSHNDVSEYKNVIIDVGKTFREAALRWMPRNSIYSIDAIVLTHEHADAVLGLDDLRGFQRVPFMLKSNNNNKTYNNTAEVRHEKSSSTLPVFLSIDCFKKVKQQFDYLVPTSCCNDIKDEGSNNVALPVVERAVASLQFHIVDHFKPFEAGGLEMTPLPVMHGEDLICNGYAFSLKRHQNIQKEDGYIGHGKTTNVIYLSDISRMIPETEEFILNRLPPTDILIIDSLLMKDKHPVHFSLKQAMEVVKRLKPRRTFIVGINCDDFPEHDEANTLLKKLDPSVQLAYDGLVIEV